jgi:hypothetical protein
VVLVVDVLTGDGAGACPARTTWPLHPDLTVDESSDGTDGAVVARRDGDPVLRIVTAATAPLTGWRLYGGDEGAGELGWWSDRLEARRPCWFVGAQVAPDAGPVIVATLLAAGAAEDVDEPAIETGADGTVRVRWSGTSGPRETVVGAPSSGAGHTTGSGSVLPAPIGWGATSVPGAAPRDRRVPGSRRR